MNKAIKLALVAAVPMLAMSFTAAVSRADIIVSQTGVTSNTAAGNFGEQFILDSTTYPTVFTAPTYTLNTVTFENG